MKYEVKFTSQFKKDLKKAKKQHKDLNELFSVIETLAEGGLLDTKYHAIFPVIIRALENAILNRIGCLCMKL